MSVVALFGAVKNLLCPKSKGADITTNLFLVSRYMGIAFVIFSILTCSKQFFGEPLLCKPAVLPPNIFNQYCFMTGTKTWKADTRTEHLAASEAHKGVHASPTDKAKATVVVHDYYQWVPFILFFMAILCYLPYRAWKAVEGGKLSKLLVKISNDPLTEVPLNEQVEGISRFLSSNPGWYDCYARKKIFCEVAVLISAVFQMYMLDLVFDGQFFGLGSAFMNVNASWEHYRVIEEIFPLATSCAMAYTGPAGAPIKDSGMCVMSINILNQKIFLAVWYMLLFMIICASIKVLFNLVLLCFPGLRYVILRSQAKSLPSHILSALNRQSSYGTYTLYMLIARNVDGAQFESMLTLLSDKNVGDRPEIYPSSFVNISNLASVQKQFGDYPEKSKQEISPIPPMRPRLMSG